MDPRASLPAIGRLVARDDVRALIEAHGRPAVVEALREAVDRARGGPVTEGSVEAIVDDAVAALAAARTLLPAINATGVVLHTNLGRAPLAAAAREAIAREGSGYATLEYDLASGGRGSRHAHAATRLRRLTGAEDALVANNAAAALVLALAALGRGDDRASVIVSRGELVEIGGAFRIPEVVEAGSARLVEVGTTNRTRIADYRRALDALGERPAVLLKVHRSNFAIVGFTEEASVDELATLGSSRAPRVPVVYDLGSGLLVPGDEVGLPDEPDVPAAVRAGADVVVFSGDKLLGGPQAGVAVGREAAIAAMRRHPLMRALRAGKLVLAALDATLAAYERREIPAIPTLAALTASKADVEARARRLQAGVGVGEVVDTIAKVGGGAQPLAEIPSSSLRVVAGDPDALAARLRRGSPVVVGRIDGDALLFDLRTVDDAEVDALAEAIRTALARPRA